MNIKLLREIAKVIVEKPRQLNMNYGHQNKAVRAEDYSRNVYKTYEALCDLPQEKQITCGTTHCIAGWAQALSPNRRCKSKAENDAKRLLEITAAQARRLFICDFWPEQFHGKKDPWNPTRKQAVARIEHFIKTAGKE